MQKEGWGDVVGCLELTSSQMEIAFILIGGDLRASQVAPVVKNSPVNARDLRELGSIPGSGGFPWRRGWPPTPVFLPGESNGQRSLAGYSYRVGYDWIDLGCLHALRGPGGVQSPQRESSLDH